jgi:ATP-dependent Lhr-like helicase
VVLVDDVPALYVERGGRGLVLLAERAGESEHRAQSAPDPVTAALVALAEAVRAGRAPKLSLERIDGEPAIGSPLTPALVELGFQTGPRRLTLSA